MSDYETHKSLNARENTLLEINRAFAGIASGSYGPGEYIVALVTVPLIVLTVTICFLGVFVLAPEIDQGGIWAWLTASLIAFAVMVAITIFIKRWGSSYNQNRGTWAEMIASQLHGYVPLCAAGYEQVVNASPAGELDAEVLSHWVESQELPEVKKRLNELKPRKTIKLQESYK